MVVAELVDPNTTIDLYKGLHFPASDIPAQARELYKIDKVRLLYDRDQVTSRLVCRTLEDLGSPLDMTHAYIRAMSPIHLKYWHTSRPVSNVNNRQLIQRFMGVDLLPQLRKCWYARVIPDTQNVPAPRKRINTAPTETNPSGYIIASSDDLLQLFDADYGVWSIRHKDNILGDNNNSQEVLALLEFFRIRHLGSVLASRDIVKDFHDFHYSQGLKVISGLLYVPVSTGRSDFIAFFRRGQLTEIKWAGDPYEIEKRKQTAG
ncbi:CheY-like superfamily [Penicillium mononematosum]|uniref:CheY-like superfamily n=1 Tax=Penicillium mononematosum TaxID=268346 RepID=UPI002546CF25|nr:CheY-like superfamily [Penicillium mononematosum]KAJ6191504.1 CheY-like superfamily [Penicillium mononematosum]